MASNRRHLKRTSMPNSWPIQKKTITFVGKPKPGSHKRDYVVSALILLRDVLGYAHNLKEAKFILNEREVLVNGKKISDVKVPIGIFDIVEIPLLKESYVVLFDSFGKIKLVKSKSNELLLKVSSKKNLKGGKFQLNFMNGYNIIVDEKTFKKVSVNDSVKYDFKNKKIKEIVPLKDGSYVYLYDGKYVGRFGLVKSFKDYNGISKTLVTLNIDGVEQSTIKDYCYAIGLKPESVEDFS